MIQKEQEIEQARERHTKFGGARDYPDLGDGDLLAPTQLQTT